MTDTVRNMLAELKSGLDALYQGWLRGLYVYGSCARGEQTRGSDLDLLVVLDEVGAYGPEIDRTSELISSVSLRYTVSISRVFVSQAAWRDVQHGFLAQVRQEAIAA